MVNAQTPEPTQVAEKVFSMPENIEFGNFRLWVSPTAAMGELEADTFGV